MLDADGQIQRILSNNPELADYNPQWAHLVKSKKNQVRPSKSMWKSEDDFMRSLFQHFDRRAHGDPRWSLIYHPANENAHRRPGVRGGVPDLCLPIPCRGFGSAYCELKINGGSLQLNQVTWISRLKTAGNYVEVVFESQERVLEILEWYLGDSE